MKNSDNKKLYEKLKQEFALLQVPNIKDKIITKHYYEKQTRTKPQRRWRPVLITTLTAVFAFLLIGYFLISPVADDNIIKEKDVMAFEAFSAVSLMPEANSVNNSLPLKYGPKENNPQLPNIDEDVEDIHKYIYLVEQVLTLNKQLKIMPINNPDMAIYEHQEKIEITTVFDDILNYEFYYNLTKSEKEWSANGIIVQLEHELSFIATKITEENKSIVSLTAYLDKDNQVEIKQELKKNKNLFQLKIIEKAKESTATLTLNKKINRFEIDLSVNNKKFICYRNNNSIRIEPKHYQTKIKIDINKNKEKGEYEYRNNQNEDVKQKKEPKRYGKGHE
ncbi:MAG: hypothetical protein PHT03_05920 [Bacilli bacterium]|nr:hypothetical protein [Bacilli bacterium]